MVHAVRAVHDGDVWFKAAATRPPDRVFTAAPTGRQLQVLRLLEEGHQDGEVARLLHVSRWTVRFHLKNLFGKLHASSRTEVIHVARRHGWLGGPPLQ
jgi:DNA-binding NarL/FixJ family response regulator